MKPGKILYVINHIDWFWSHRLPLALGAKKNGWDVHVAVHGASKDPRFAAHGFTPHELPKGTFATISGISKTVKQLQPDLVHAVTMKYAFLTGMALHAQTHIRTVYTIAGLGYLFSDEGLRPKLLRWLVNPLLRGILRPATIIVQNPDDQELMIARGFVNPANCTLIRGSGVDTDQFPFTDEPDNKIPVIVLPARLLRDKGVVEFIEAAKILRQRGRQVDCRIAGGYAGDNPLAISPEEMKNLTADGAATWVGKTDNMPELLSGCNLVVFPSYREGLPKTLLEAASTGRAIITTDRPGCREVVKHELNGLLVPVRDAKAIADAVEKLIDDDALRKKMGLAGRVRAEKEFDVKLVVKQTLLVYSRI
jgi:glycosyltransferase involved in cell wall biosynthesis